MQVAEQNPAENHLMRGTSGDVNTTPKAPPPHVEWYWLAGLSLAARNHREICIPIHTLNIVGRCQAVGRDNGR
jgi:hypothetical protein